MPAIIDGLKEKISSLKDNIKAVTKEIVGLKDEVTAAAKKVQPEDGAEKIAVDAVEKADTTLQQQREELEKAQGLLAATERRFGLFVASAVKTSPGIMRGVATEIINPTTRLEVIEGLPPTYKKRAEEELSYKAVKGL